MSKTDKLSKQQRYQQDHARRGLCVMCPQPAVPGSKHCAKHLLKRRKAERAAGGWKAHREGGPGRRPIKID